MLGLIMASGSMKALDACLTGSLNGSRSAKIARDRGLSRHELQALTGLETHPTTQRVVMDA